MNPLTLDIVLAWLHFLAIIGTASILVAELVLCRPGIAGDALARLRRIDGAYGAFAVVALATGLSRAVWGIKGGSFYWKNPVFHTKVSVFVLIALLSIVPTLRYLRWMKTAPPDAAAVRSTRHWLHAQALLFVALPLLAATMARGIGHR